MPVFASYFNFFLLYLLFYFIFLFCQKQQHYSLKLFRGVFPGDEHLVGVEMLTFCIYSSYCQLQLLFQNQSIVLRLSDSFSCWFSINVFIIMLLGISFLAVVAFFSYHLIVTVLVLLAPPFSEIYFPYRTFLC